jgi:hypothetical protein
MKKVYVPFLSALFLTACQQVAPADSSRGNQVVTAPLREVSVFFAPFGDGYPKPGDPCRTLGESDNTRNWLGDGTVLVGCPSLAAAKSLGGRIVETKDGVTMVLISVPL